MVLVGKRFPVKEKKLMKLTIKDIAEMAGVSIATVSRVLNNSKPVSEEVRKRVEKVLEETNFRPNAWARSLIQNKTNLIGVIIPQINTFSAKLIDGIEDIASQNGYNIILSNTRLNREQELKAIDILIEKQVDGLIFSAVNITAENVEKIYQSKIPAVVVGQKVSEYNLPWVDVDNYSSIVELVQYLIRCGHKKLAMIHGPLYDMSAGYTRYKAFIDEVERHQIPKEDVILVESNFSMQDGYYAMEKILKNRSLPTAVISASDEIAIGAKKCLEDRGFIIPDDMSIVGFDDIDLAQITRPKLTTVRVDFFEMGSIAMKTLLRLLSDEKEVSLEHYVDYRLIIRDSVKMIR